MPERPTREAGLATRAIHAGEPTEPQTRAHATPV